MTKIEFYTFIVASIIVAVLLFLRKRINYRLYNSEHGTNFKPLGFMQRDSRIERLACEFTFFYLKVKPENRRLAIMNNIMSATVILYILFLVIWANFFKGANKVSMPDFTTGNATLYTCIIIFIVVSILSIVRRKINAKLFTSEIGENFKPYELINNNDRIEKAPRIKPFFYWKVKPENRTLALINNILSVIVLATIALLVFSIFYFDVSVKNIK